MSNPNHGSGGAAPFQYVGAANRKSQFRKDMTEEELLAMQDQFMQSGAEPSASFVRHRVDRSSLAEHGLMDNDDGTNPSRRLNRRNANLDCTEEEDEEDGMEMGPCATLVRAKRPEGGIGKIGNSTIVEERDARANAFQVNTVFDDGRKDDVENHDSDPEDADFKKVMGGLAVVNDTIVARERPKKKTVKMKDVVSLVNDTPQSDVVQERVRTKPKSVKRIDKSGFPGFMDNADEDNRAKGESLFSLKRKEKDGRAAVAVSDELRPKVGTKQSAFALQRLNKERASSGLDAVLVDSHGYIVDGGSSSGSSGNSDISKTVPTSTTTKTTNTTVPTTNSTSNMYKDICGVQVQDVNNDAGNIFNSMSEEARVEARNELLGELSPGLIAALKRRKALRERKDDVAPNTATANSGADIATKTIDHTGSSLTEDQAPYEYIPQIRTDTSSETTHAELSAHLDVANERKKANWLLPYQEQENALKGGGQTLPVDVSVVRETQDGAVVGLLGKQSAVAETGVPSVLVGDWLNFRLAQDGTVATEVDDVKRELMHHGAQPGRPGYTLQELGMLCRSSVAQQRALAWGVIASVISRCRRLEYGDTAVMVFLLVRLPLQPQLRAAIDDSVKTVHTAAIGALLALIEPYPGFFTRKNESSTQQAILTSEPVPVAEIGNTVFTQPRSGSAVVFQDISRIFKDEKILESIHEARGDKSPPQQTVMTEDDVLGTDQMATFDVIAALLPMAQLPRLRYLADSQCDLLRAITGLSSELLPKIKAAKSLLVQILSVFLSLCMHSANTTTLVHFTPFLHGLQESAQPTAVYDADLAADSGKLPSQAILSQLNMQLVSLVCKILERVSTVDRAYAMQWTSRGSQLSKLSSVVLSCPTVVQYSSSPSQNILAYCCARSAAAVLSLFSVLMKCNVHVSQTTNLMYIHLLPLIGLFPTYTTITTESPELVCVYKHLYNSYLGLHTAATQLWEFSLGAASLEFLKSVQTDGPTPAATLTQLGMATEQVLQNIQNNLSIHESLPIVPNTTAYYTAILHYLASYYSCILLHPQLGSPALIPIIAPEIKLDDQVVVEITRQYLQVKQLVQALLSPNNSVHLTVLSVLHGKLSTETQFKNPTTKFLCPSLPFVEVVSRQAYTAPWHDVSLADAVLRVVSVCTETCSLLQQYTRGINMSLRKSGAVERVTVHGMPMHPENVLSTENPVELPFTSDMFVNFALNLMKCSFTEDGVLVPQLAVAAHTCSSSVFTNQINLHGSIVYSPMSTTEIVVSESGALYTSIFMDTAAQQCQLQAYSVLIQSIPVLLYNGNLGAAVESIQLLCSPNLHCVLAALVQKEHVTINHESVLCLKDTLKHFIQSIPALLLWCHQQVDTVDSSVVQLLNALDIILNVDSPETVFMSPTELYDISSTNDAVYIPLSVDVYTNPEAVKTIQMQYTHQQIPKLADQLLHMTKSALHRCASIVFVQSLGSTYSALNQYSGTCKMLLEQGVSVRSNTVSQVFPSSYVCGIVLNSGRTSFSCSPQAGVHHPGFYASPLKIISDVYNRNQDIMEKQLVQISAAGAKRQEYLANEQSRLEQIALNTDFSAVTESQKQGLLGRLRELVQELQDLPNQVATEIDAIVSKKKKLQSEQTIKLDQLLHAVALFTYPLQNKSAQPTGEVVHSVVSCNEKVRVTTNSTHTTTRLHQDICSSLYTALCYIFLMGYDVYTSVSPALGAVIAIVQNPTVTFPLTYHTAGLSVGHLRLASVRIMDQWSGILSSSSNTSIQALLSIPHLHNLSYKLFTSVVDQFLEDSSGDVVFTNFLLPYLSNMVPRDYSLYQWNKVFVPSLSCMQEQYLSMGVEEDDGSTALHPYYMMTQSASLPDSGVSVISLEGLVPASFSPSEARVHDVWIALTEDASLVSSSSNPDSIKPVRHTLLYILARAFLVQHHQDLDCGNATTPQAVLDCLLCTSPNGTSIPPSVLLACIGQGSPLPRQYQTSIQNMQTTLHQNPNNTTFQVLINVLENINYE